MIGRLSRSAWVRVVVSVAILGYLVSTVDVESAAAAIVGISAWHLAGALVLVGLDRFLMICRWALLLTGTGTAIRFKSAAWIFLVSSFVGSFTPAGIGGDAARAWTLARRTADGGGAVASVAVDRLLGVIAVALLGAVGAAAWYGRGAGSASLRVLAIGVGLTAAVISTLWSDRVYEKFVPAGWKRGWVARFGRLAHAVGAYRSAPRRLIVVFALSVAVQVVRVFQSAVLAAGLGLSVSLGYFFVFMPVGLLLWQLPVSVSGFGAPQGAVVWMLRPQGVPESEAFALSTLVVLIAIAGNLPGAWLFFRDRGR